MTGKPETPWAFRGENLQIGYSDKPVISGMDLRIPQEKITSIIGPNGCGKSTLLKGLARIIPLQSGTVWLEGQDMAKLGTRETAQIMAMLPQGPQAPEGLTVEELVSFGRYPHQRGLQSLKEEDRKLIERAMRETKVYDLRHRSVDRLSGGQRQRVWIAMALAQDTPVILLDEPTTYLDMAHQLEILELLEKLNREQHKTIVVVIHDLNMAARFSDYLIAMKQGQLLHGLQRQGLLGSGQRPKQTVGSEADALRHLAGGCQEILGPLHDDAQFFQAVNMERTRPPGAEDAPGGGEADAGDPQQAFVVRTVDLNGKLLQVGQGPAAFGVYPCVKVPVGLVQQFVCPEAVEAQQPVRLIEPVFPQ